MREKYTPSGLLPFLQPTDDDDAAKIISSTRTASCTDGRAKKTNGACATMEQAEAPSSQQQARATHRWRPLALYKSQGLPPVAQPKKKRKGKTETKIPETRNGYHLTTINTVV